MTEQTQKSSNGHSRIGTNATAAMAGVAGAVVGAGVAVAATQILSDKNTREKVKQTFNKVRTQVMDTIHEEQKRMKASSANGQKKLETGKEKKKVGSKREHKPVMESGMHQM